MRNLQNNFNFLCIFEIAGMVSLPFPSGKQRRVVIKVIDPRVNEVMRFHKVWGGN